MDKPAITAPAPWLLTGHGMVLLYHFPGSFINQFGFLDPYQEATFKGWLGAVMLNCYETSNVGPYYELLFIPGLFLFGRRLSFSISKIYVSSEDSAQNGQDNWGIPKELADFKVTNLSDGSQIIEVGPPAPGQYFFRLHIKKWGWALPFTTQLIPLNRIIQQASADLLQTRPQVRGKVQFCSVEHILVNPRFFPPINQLKPLASFYLPQFKLVFPVPKILTRRK